MIKPIDEIPQAVAEKQKGYRQRITDDMLEAVEKGVTKFEFIGDYNYKYLAKYAKEQADKISNKLVRNALIEIKNTNPDDDRYKLFSVYEVKNTFPFHISSIKSDNPGERRVFCEIDPLDSLKDRVMAELERLRKERDARNAARQQRPKLKLDYYEREEPPT